MHGVISGGAKHRPGTQGRILVVCPGFQTALRASGMTQVCLV
jgi:hypothetical protein